MKTKIICLLFLFASSTLWGQTTKSTNTIIVDNYLFYLHEVTKGQTLYQLSNMYNVPVDSIIKYNHNADKMIAIGQQLHIPISKTKVEYYTIKNGDSWFSIAKKFNISEKELFVLNPSKLNSTILSLNEKIIVPLIEKDDSEIATSISNNSKNSTKKKISENTKKSDNIVVQKGNIVHIVEKGETLYSIAKKYNVKIDEIKKINPTLMENNISPEQQILIPEVQGVINSPTPATSIADMQKVEHKKLHLGEKKNNYVVYVFIPLYTSQGTEIETSNIKTLDDYNHIKQFSFIQYYEALLLATEDISKQYPNILIDLHVEDVNNFSSAKMEQLINNGSLKNADLIIGPFFGKEFVKLCQYAEQENITIVNPFSITFEGCGANVYKATASYKKQAICFANYIANRYQTANVIFINNQSNKENEIIQQFSSIFNNTFNESTTHKISVKEINMKTSGIAGIKSAINPSCENFIFAFFDGEITVTNFVQSIHRDNYQNISLVAPESWSNYDNIETEYFMDIKTHYISQYYVDYSKPEVINFLDRFREKYAIEPTLNHFAFQGYDITYYFLCSLCENGTAFSNCEIANKNLLSTQFHFQLTNDNMLENSFVNIFKIKDYRFVEATSDLETEESSLIKPKKE